MRIQLKDKSIVDVQCQEYEIGLYVCIYGENGRMIEQFGTSVPKEQFLEEIKSMGKVLAS